MGRVNNAFAYDKKRSQRMGKLYNTIDFNVNDKISADLFAKVPEKPIVGELEQVKFDIYLKEVRYEMGIIYKIF